MQKLEFLNLEPKMCYLGVLASNFEQSVLYFKSAPSNLPCCNVLFKKKKFLNFGPKMSDFRILELEFEKIIVIFEISIFEFVLLQSFVQK